MTYHYLIFFFFFNDTATTEIYTLSLHDALPISRPERRASQRGGVGERPARRVPARAAVPRLAVRREPDLLQDGFHRFRLWPVPVLGDRERLGDLHPARHRFLHHRGARPRRLPRPHHLAPPEQLVPRTQQRMVEAPLARQDVHEAQVQTIHRHRARDGPKAAQAPDLTEPAARLRLLEH